MLRRQVFSAPTAPVVAVAAPPPTTPRACRRTPPRAARVRCSSAPTSISSSKQIKIAEAHAGRDGPAARLDPEHPRGLRAAHRRRQRQQPGQFGGFNQTDFGAADTTFPRLLDPRSSRPRTCSRQASSVPDHPRGTTPTSYQQTSGYVFDADPRTISNLIVDQTANNPAAVAALRRSNGGATAGAASLCRRPGSLVTSPGLDGLFGTADDKQVFFIPNVTPDVGLYRAVQCLDDVLRPVLRPRPRSGDQGRHRHGLHPAAAGRSALRAGQPDQFHGADARDQLPGPTASRTPTHDRGHRRRHPRTENTTTPFVDQNQTYTLASFAPGVPARL